jgi:hypothetical protein
MSHQRLEVGERKAEQILRYRERNWYGWQTNIADRDRIKGILRDTRHPCSCFMCGHRRRWEGPAIRELRRVEETDESGSA